MKKTLLIALNIAVALVSCKKDDISHQSEFNKSYQAWKNFQQEVNNSYSYTVNYGSVFGFAADTKITVTNGVVTKREYKAIYPANSPAPVNPVVWTEDQGQIGSHSDGAPALTLDQIYDKAKNEWLNVNTKDNDVFFETKNNGMISGCGYVPKGCQDDCFRGITITNISRVVN
ncbi:hypothetical protein MUY27_07270 [Mucilaginibacter sp. RS28]|uniref:Uncharacterized protein n=1 Tax=Mucilaginibacter straminoryzae TaxID=2932774 RepID=A0A9X2B8D2_9SPHI|nr:hypothetical protein [Mucilaginibacter straminoryzae]MCJ8209504.1 hypothetical protein [Mucilaginibacter straminoryzae]